MRRSKILGGGVVAFAVAANVACGAILDVDGYALRSGDAPDAGLEAQTEATTPPVAEAGPECTLNADCAGRGDYFVCRKADKKCIALQSPDCSRIVGDYKDDNAILIGSVAPTAGADQSSGLPIQNSIEVAIEDFRSVGNVSPAPGTSARRPIVLVGCNDNSEDDVAVRAARHLAETVKVPVIIGAAFSGITIKVATDVTIPAGVLLVSPSATSVAITNLQDNGLVWRTSPSDIIQADAHAALYPLIETVLKAGSVPGTDPVVGAIRVAIANKGDAYGTGLAGALTSKLVINGSKATTPANENNFKRFDYGDPDAPPVSYPAAINGINTLKPHVIYLLGTTETINDMMVGIEAGWDDANPRPIYLLADGALVQEVTDAANSVAAKATTPPLRKRIYGTVPGTSNENFQTFRILYDSRIKDGSSASTGGAANAYDAVYNIAYSVVAAGDKPITGAVIRDGFAKLVPPGTPLTAGAANINTAFQKLANGEKIDFAGASGPLDYDLTTGEASSDIQIWCLPPESSAPGANAGPGRSTPVSYDAQGQALAGGNFSSISSFCKLTQ